MPLRRLCTTTTILAILTAPLLLTTGCDYAFTIDEPGQIPVIDIQNDQLTILFRIPDVNILPATTPVPP